MSRAQIRSLCLGLVLSLLGGISYAPSVFAAGESYVFQGSGFNTTNGFGGQNIKASGGAYTSDGATFVKTTASGVDKRSGYTIFYNGDLNLKPGGSSSPECRTANVFIAFKSESSRQGIIYTSSEAKNTDRCLMPVENLNPSDSSLRLSSNITVAVNPAYTEMLSAITTGLSDALSGPRSSFLSTPHCVSSVGISNCLGTWNTAVQTCVVQAVNQATERESELRNYNTGFDKESYAKSQFASCLSSATSNRVSTSSILQAVSAISLIDIESNARSAAEASAAQNDASGNPDDSATSSCAVQGIGWIVCPVMNFLGRLNDAAFDFLANSFLETESRLINDEATKKAWESFRNIANIMFVVAFLAIVYGQMTGGRK